MKTTTFWDVTPCSLVVNFTLTHDVISQKILRFTFTAMRKSCHVVRVTQILKLINLSRKLPSSPIIRKIKNSIALVSE
jgi:hypothetical protein